MPAVDVVVAARDEQAVIGRLVERIAQLSYPQGQLRLWVIDDASRDRTPQLLAELQQRYPFLQVLRREADAGGGKRFDRAGRNCVGADAFGSQTSSKISCNCLKTRFCRTHRVVVRYHALCAEIGKRQARRIAALHHRQRRFCQCRIAVARNIVGNAKIFTCHAVQKITADGFARRECDGMQQAVESAPFRLQFGVQRSDLVVLLLEDRVFL